MSRIFFYQLLLFVSIFYGFCDAHEIVQGVIVCEQECTQNSLDIETAWLRICHFAPSMAASDMQIHIQEANLRQAGLGPNPIFSVDGQNLGVNPDIDAEAPQTTYALSQLLELGGKRAARKRLADAETGLAYWDLQIQRQDLRCQLAHAFIGVSVAQEKLYLAQERLRIAEHIAQATRMQVEAGKISPIQEKKAKLSLKTAEISLRESLSFWEQEKQKLAAMWGGGCSDFDHVCFDIYENADIPCYDVAEGVLRTPDFCKAQAVIYAAQRNVVLQKTIATPDVTVTLGYRTYSDSDQRGWVVGAAIPLPVRNKNQGNVERAHYEVSQAQYYSQEIVRTLQEKARVFYERLQAAHEEVQMIQTGILTEAMDTFDLTKTGYENGKFPYLDLLDAQGMLFEIKEKYIDILANYHINKAELMRLCGGSTQ